MFRATVPDNSWLAIGFGNTMTNTDMISWQVTNGVGKTRDYWSNSHSTPQLDRISNLKDEVAPLFDATTKTMTFVTRRPLDTGDTT